MNENEIERGTEIVEMETHMRDICSEKMMHNNRDYEETQIDK